MDKPESNLEPKPRKAIKGMAPYNTPKEEEIQACHQLKKSQLQSSGMRKVLYL
jgi:hypothetical protein